MTAQGYPHVLIHFVGPLPVVLCALLEPTDAEIANDLRLLSHAECARLDLRHSSDDDHTEIECLVVGALTLEYRDLMRARK